jgi:glycine/D-amino acid oxidase-like deaminating enzyme
MNTEFLIIGQGLCGTWLSYWLKEMGRSVLVLDEYKEDSPSRVAAGIINPVTGRRHVSTWKADILMPFAKEQYKVMGTKLGTKSISEKTLIDFFPSPQMRLSFLKRVEEKGEYVSLPSDEDQFRQEFNYDLGFGKIFPTYTAHLEELLPAWRRHLLSEGELVEDHFDRSALKMEEGGISYKSIEASSIIFCDGPSGVEDPWFRNLPYAVNKGEMLLLQIPDLDADHLYKRSVSLVPLAEKGLWWVGSNYGWELEPVRITEAFRSQTETLLKSWLKPSFKVIDHKISLRPANIERRPFVGKHPLHPSIAILNGMGSKGTSLAPWYAKQLAEHLVSGKPIDPEASVDRFRQVLSR